MFINNFVSDISKHSIKFCESFLQNKNSKK